MSSGNGVSNADRSDTRTLVIERGKSFQIAAPQKDTEYRVEVCAINGYTYVGLVKYYYKADLKKWLPTKKTCYMPPVVWRELLVRSQAISQALKAFEKTQAEVSAFANSGTFGEI